MSMRALLCRSLLVLRRCFRWNAPDERLSQFRFVCTKITPWLRLHCGRRVVISAHV